MRCFSYTILSGFILSFIFVACTRHSEAWAELDAVEAIIDVYPDSALMLLQAIDTTKLRGEEEKARYSLLSVHAFDNNGIFLTNPDIINHAVDYYTLHGTTEQKMTALFLEGTLYQNGRKEDMALSSYIKALELRPYTSDSILVACVLVAQGLIYTDLYQNDKALENYLEAASIYGKKQKRASEIRTLYKALASSIRINDKQKADSVFALIQAKMPNCNDDFKVLETINLNYYVKFCDDSLIVREINRFISDGNMYDNKLVELAGAYSHLGEHQKALELFQKIDTTTVKNSLRFLAYASEIYANAGLYKEAYEYNNTFYVKMDSTDLKLYNSDILFLENKHRLELKALQEKNAREKTLFWCFAGILILCAIIIYSRYRFVSFRKNKQLEIENHKLITENLELRISQLNEESERLKEILDNQKELTIPVKQAIKERLQILNGILAREISSNDTYAKPSRQSIEDILQDKDKFMDSTRLAFKASHPEFISFLENRNLSVEEINYVCLYAIGLRGKEVGAYIQLKRHYNISSEIRKKLGLDEHATNLGIYIRRLMDADPAPK